MKYIILCAVLSACGNVYNQDLQDHLEAEQYFHAVQQYPQYDPDYIDDCIHYKDLVCEFE